LSNVEVLCARCTSLRARKTTDAPDRSIIICVAKAHGRRGGFELQLGVVILRQIELLVAALEDVTFGAALGE